jgi:hypothetical protein
MDATRGVAADRSAKSFTGESSMIFAGILWGLAISPFVLGLLIIATGFGLYTGSLAGLAILIGLAACWRFWLRNDKAFAWGTLVGFACGIAIVACIIFSFINAPPSTSD